MVLAMVELYTPTPSPFTAATSNEYSLRISSLSTVITVLVTLAVCLDVDEVSPYLTLYPVMIPLRSSQFTIFHWTVILVTPAVADTEVGPLLAPVRRTIRLLRAIKGS